MKVIELCLAVKLLLICFHCLLYSAKILLSQPINIHTYSDFLMEPHIPIHYVEVAAFFYQEVEEDQR